MGNIIFCDMSNNQGQASKPSNHYRLDGSKGQSIHKNVNKFAAVLSKHEINFNLGVQEGYMALPTEPNRIEQEL